MLCQPAVLPRLLAWHPVTHEMLSHHHLLQRILVRLVAGQSSLRFDGLFHILILDRPHKSWLYILDVLGTTHFDLNCEVRSLVCIACSPCENLESLACPSAIQSWFPLLDLHSVHNRSFLRDVELYLTSMLILIGTFAGRPRRTFISLVFSLFCCTSSVVD